jgi:serine/threonine protein kinase
MGTVYRGVHTATGQVVAVKVMASETAANPVLVSRFEQEFAAANRLCHPNIVRGLDFGIDQGRPFLVMELVNGQSLGKLVRQHGPLAESDAVRLALQLADALSLAHRENLIHRDVKPDNVLLTADGQAKLADLGLVKDLDGEALTYSGAWVGTVDFMAPEQFGEASEVDARSDVYGLAATLYFALTGLPPFHAPGALSVLAKKLKNHLVPARQHIPSLSPRIDQVLRRALDADKERRPASCAAFAALLCGEGPVADTDAEDRPCSPEPDPADRRRAIRFPSSLPGSCGPLQGGVRRWQAEVEDISLTGIRLRLDRRFEPATLLSVELAGKEADVSSLFLVRVHWVRQTAPKVWSAGCSFSQPLEETDLYTLVGNVSSTVVISQADGPPGS